MQKLSKLSKLHKDLRRLQEDANDYKSDIESWRSGFLVEERFNSILEKSFPKKIRVDKGYLFDTKGVRTNEIDTVISDALDSVPIYEESENSKFIHYDSVFAIGEIKKSYYEKKPKGTPKERKVLFNISNKINKDIKKISRKENLSVIDINGKLHLPNQEQDKIKNQLLKFVYFNEKGEISDKILTKELNNLESEKLDKKNLPNIIYIYDFMLLIRVQTEEVNDINLIWKDRRKSIINPEHKNNLYQTIPAKNFSPEYLTILFYTFILLHFKSCILNDCTLEYLEASMLAEITKIKNITLNRKIK